MVDELVLSQQDQLQIDHFVHQVTKAGVVQVVFFSAILIRCDFRYVKNWPKQTVTRAIAAQYCCWLLSFSFGLVIKCCSH